MKTYLTDNVRFAPLVLALILALIALLMQGCSAPSVVTALDGVVVAAETAVSVLSATGQLPAPVAALVNNYLASVGAAADFAATELASGDTTGVKITKIVGEFATVAAPQLPPGVSQAILAAVQAVVNEVAKFLAHIEPTAKRGAALHLPAIKLSPADQVKLLSIHSRAHALAMRGVKP